MLNVDGPASGARGVDQVVAAGIDLGGQPSHRSRQPDQLGDRLALGPQRDQERAGLDLPRPVPP